MLYETSSRVGERRVRGEHRALLEAECSFGASSGARVPLRRSLFLAKIPWLQATDQVNGVGCPRHGNRRRMSAIRRLPQEICISATDAGCRDDRDWRAGCL